VILDPLTIVINDIEKLKCEDNMSIIFNKRSHGCNFYDPYDQASIEGVLPRLQELKNYGRNDGLVKGVVRLFENGKLVDECMENLVVANGRKFVAQRLFGTRHPSDPPVFDWEISHFGVGSGGATISGSNVNLVGPETCDLDLNTPIPFSGSPVNTAHLTSPGDAIRGIVPSPYTVKSIEPSGLTDIILTNDIDCAYGPTYSYVRAVCVKSISEPNYLPNESDYIMINESALYLSDGTDTEIFAHICFPPKYIEKKSEFVIEWFILC